MHVVATAGHVDHGKSTLVRALTGMEPDRFAEERRRGMTIDLGYAWTALASGEVLAFVDVPGHQRFIANMLAGLGPAPAVLFVVAADEGWGRQSAEHLAAIDALDIRHGLLAVTRSDLADPAPALRDARDRLAATSLGSVEAVTVSGLTGAGLDELRGALGRLVSTLPAPRPDEPVRLWIDRSFSIRGAGTVVTGTLGTGTISVGDELELLTRSGARSVMVRGLQSTGVTVQSTAAVARVAVNLRGVAEPDVGRGDLLLTPDTWHLADTLDVGLSTSTTLPTELVLHLGTASVPVRVRPLSASIARLTLARPLPARADDRAVLRDPGRQSVTAGVHVLDADPPALRRRGAAAARGLELVDGLPRLDALAEVARRGIVRRSHLRRLGIDVGAATALDGWLVADERWTQWRAQAAPEVDRWAREHPLEPAMPLAALRHALDLPDSEAVTARVVSDAGLTVDTGRVRRADAARSLGAAEAAVRTIEDRLRQDPFAAPDRTELADLRLGVRETAAAVRLGRLIRVSADILLLPDAVDIAVERLGALTQPFTASQARTALDATRRVAIPLLEHLDELGRTERVDTSLRRVVGDPTAALGKRPAAP
jgi:selenocysteine-specific elongation factor